MVCMRGHRFESSLKKAKKAFCPDCKRLKEEQKQKFMRNYEEVKTKQNQMLKESMTKLIWNRQSSSESIPSKETEDVLSIFEQSYMCSHPALCSYA